jgi:hypothetical protein
MHNYMNVSILIEVTIKFCCTVSSSFTFTFIIYKYQQTVYILPFNNMGHYNVYNHIMIQQMLHKVCTSTLPLLSINIYVYIHFLSLT